jgi:hypothetical protein
MLRWQQSLLFLKHKKSLRILARCFAFCRNSFLFHGVSAFSSRLPWSGMGSATLRNRPGAVAPSAASLAMTERFLECP